MINKLRNCIVGFWKNLTVQCSIQQWLDKDYEKPQQKINWSLFLVILVPILIFMGFLYLVGFLSRFSISYDLIYFKAIDVYDRKEEILKLDSRKGVFKRFSHEYQDNKPPQNEEL